MQAAFAGVDLGKTKKEKDDGLKEAKDRLKNPLRDFPDDIVYLNAKDCDIKIRMADNPKLSFEQKWDVYRKDCCLGNYGQAAKRCSMNNTLWGRYLKAVESDRPLNLAVIKAMVEFDMVRRELYPSDFKGDENSPPPESYLNELKSSGKYTEILQRLDTVTKKVQQNGSES